ncbi:MAG: hypothetical protein R3C26_16990 [Calditrichia bacterium]
MIPSVNGSNGCVMPRLSEEDEGLFGAAILGGGKGKSGGKKKKSGSGAGCGFLLLLIIIALLIFVIYYRI